MGTQNVIGLNEMEIYFSITQKRRQYRGAGELPEVMRDPRAFHLVCYSQNLAPASWFTMTVELQLSWQQPTSRNKK